MSEHDRPDLELRRLELEERQHRDDIEIRREELDFRKLESSRSVLHSPLVLALFAAVIGLFGNALVAWFNGNSQRLLEDRKAEAARILEAIKTGDPDIAAENLKLLVDAGLIEDRADSIRAYLESREPGQGARLPGTVATLPTEARRTFRSLALADRRPDELRIHYLNVGHGMCVVVECPQSVPIVVDCGTLGGDNSSAILAVRDILDGTTGLPNIVVSHADRDHYSLIPKVFEGYQVSQIWLGGSAQDYSRDMGPWIENQLAGGAELHHELDRDYFNQGNPIGDNLSCGLASTYILTVNSGRTKNDMSLVLGIQYGDFSAIFAGDASGLTEQQAIENLQGEVDATVLTASAHGSRTHRSNSAEWAAATSPEVVIYSAGLKFGHPRCEATGRYHDYLSDAPAHTMHCNDDVQAAADYESGLAEYVTEAVGAVVVTTRGTSPLNVACQELLGCEASIEHLPSRIGSPDQ